jgi:hypothetical protein
LIKVGPYGFFSLGRCTKSREPLNPLIEKVDRFVQKKEDRLELHID